MKIVIDRDKDWNVTNFELDLKNIDMYDLRTNIAMILNPMLIKFKTKLMGAPYVDNEDVPEHLWMPNPDKQFCTDENWFKRWNYVLDEMIWTFAQLSIDYESQYYSGDIDFQFKETDEKDPEDDEPIYEMVKGPNDTFKVDEEALKIHEERINNGLRLFSKYFRSLWN